MNESAVQQTPRASAAGALARLAEPHGYRFDGDSAHLHARFSVLNRAADERQWALQLWACPTVPTSAKDLRGQIVAEIALPRMSEVADETEHVDMSAFARPPAGGADYWMALVLASGKPSQFDEVHDIAVYPRRQSFVQPAMRGTVGYGIQGNRVHISIERIENPREATNQSGTLAVELWALAEPYTGGTFQGVPLAGVAIGALSGQTESARRLFELAFSPPPVGAWHFVLMLREWTAAGYVTRDFTNFNSPVIYAPASVQTPPERGALLSDIQVPIKETAPGKPEPPTLQAEPLKTSLDIRSTTVKPAATKPERPAATATAPEKVAAKTPGSVSVNTAAEDELAGVDGLSPKLARAIIRRRPFASLDELKRVKGITATLLSKIANRLGL